ncbi:SDR family oxidoreductase [bacterium]|nr:SDR family oxidoreductase [bacterium]
MSEKRILVTGSTGFLGCALIRELLKNQSAGVNKELIFSIARTDLEIPGTSHSVINLEDQSEVERHLKKLQPTHIYHLSGLSKVSTAISMKEYFVANTLQTLNLVNSLKKLPGKVKVLLSSSVHVYGNQQGDIQEETPVRPQSAYAFSKYLSEECLKTLAKGDERFRTVTVRLSSCFGPGQALGFVASDFARKVKEAKQKKLTKISTGPLQSFRQFMDYRDVARAFRCIMEQEQSTPFEVYNIASPKKTTMEGLLQELLSLSELEVEIESRDSGENTFQGLEIAAAKFRAQWPEFSFRPFRETLSEIWKKTLETPG